MAAKKTGFAVVVSVGGESLPDFTAEKANNNTTIGKMMNKAVAQLTQSKIKGVGGVVGTYDDQTIGEACQTIFNSAHVANFYGCSLHADYFQKIGVLQP